MQSKTGEHFELSGPTPLPSHKLSGTMNNFDFKQGKNGESKQYIFGSTSPRGMTTSDYLGSNLSVVGDGGNYGNRSLQKDSNESDNNISSCSTLDIVNKVDNLTGNDLGMQIRELSQRLQKSEKDRDDYKKKFNDAAEEKDRYYRRLEVMSSAHESRITEMHCVIAELSKKLRSKQDNVIMEENEAEGSELSYQEGSIYNSELNLTNPDAECQTDPFDADFSLDDPKIINETVAKSQVETLQEEILHLKGEIALLQSQIASTDLCSSPNRQFNSNCCISGHIGAVEEECNDCDLLEDDNELFYKTDEEDENNELIKAMNESRGKFYFDNLDDERNICLNNSAIKQSTAKFIPSGKCLITKDKLHNQVKNSPLETPVLKMAERVKIRRTIEYNNISANKIISSGTNNSEIVEHLVSDLIQSNNITDNSNEPSQVDMEFQRLQRRIEQFKLRNTVLCLTLDECKEHCDHLYLLCGKYESNAIALQAALNCSDRAIEAYDVMLALLESKLAILKENSPASEESRRAVESVARHLLQRLEGEKNLSENSLGPWQNTFSISDKPVEPWTTDDDNRLRNHVSKLKGRRSTVQNTIVNLESPFSSNYEKAKLAFENHKEFKQDNSQLDIEVAVLMQELLSLREEVIDSKKKREEAERDRQFAIYEICVLQDALQQLQVQLSDSDALFNFTSRDRSSYSEADHAALTEQQLVEALTRESELKIRIQTLIGSVSASRKSSDEKYEQVQNNIKELHKMKINLFQSMEENKRKYKSKIKRLEQKLQEMSLEMGKKHHNHHQQQQIQHHQQQHPHHHQNALSRENVPETTL